ncbi:MAG: hypothetical protein ACP5N1_04985 [Candidatus Woesearchaeota archaeon]
MVNIKIDSVIIYGLLSGNTGIYNSKVAYTVEIRTNDKKIVTYMDQASLALFIAVINNKKFVLFRTTDISKEPFLTAFKDYKNFITLDMPLK